MRINDDLVRNEIKEYILADPEGFIKEVYEISKLLPKESGPLPRTIAGVTKVLSRKFPNGITREELKYGVYVVEIICSYHKIIEMSAIQKKSTTSGSTPTPSSGA